MIDVRSALSCPCATAAPADACRDRTVIERRFRRLDDLRRAAPRDDKTARNFRSAVRPATFVASRPNRVWTLDER